MRKFARRARTYREAYRHYHGTKEKAAFQMVEKFVKESRVHRNILDQEHGFLCKVLGEEMIREKLAELGLLKLGLSVYGD